MSNQPKFTDLNPYKDSPNPIRFVSNVDKTIYNFFYAIFPTNGLQQTTINLLFAKLHAKCLSLGITPGSERSDERFQELIVGLRFELSGSTSGSVDEPTETSNDRGAVKSGCAASETAPNSSPKLSGTARKGKQRTNKRTKGN